MEQIQRRYVTFDVLTLDIKRISWGREDIPNCACLPIIDNALIEPFFNLTKNIAEYYPIIEGDIIVGLRRKGIYENQVVLETEENILRGLRASENFITKCRILCNVLDNSIMLKYDAKFFNALDDQENIDRLKLTDKSLYNIYITRKGDPFTIYGVDEISLAPFAKNETVVIPYTGKKDISVYVVTKN